MRNDRFWIRWALVALVALVCTLPQWFAQQGRLATSTDHLVTDPLRRALASERAEDRLTVIDIDEASIGAVGPWPWPRARVADLLENLVATYGVRGVGVDIVFPSPADAAGDARLAALAQIAPVTFAQALDFVPRSPPLMVGLPVFEAPRLSAARGQAASATGYMANHPGLASARCVGNIGLQPDEDGRIRSVPLLARWEGRQNLLLPLAMLVCPAGALASGVEASALLPDDPEAWSLPFSRAWEAYTVIPAQAVLDGSAPASLLEGRYVLVGSSALGLNDRAATPLSAAAAGVMVHASAMTSLLDRLDGSRRPLPVDGRWVASAWTLLTLAAAAWALGRFKAWWLIPALLAAVVCWLGVAAWLMSNEASFHAGAPLVGYLLMLLVVTVELWLTQREQGRILRSFATYVAPEVLREMLRNGVENPMVPQQREITVLSADMQDYTGLTKRSGLQDAARMTREFLGCLTDPVLEHGGTVDKYTGDGLVAFWGAPLPVHNHAQLALQAAQAIVENVRRWNERRAAEGLAPARVRIGVESGSALVGDLGTDFRRTYTAVGDCINAASKLQAVAKTLSSDLVVGPVAAHAAADAGLVPVVQMQLPGHNEVSVLWSFPSLSSSVPEPGGQLALRGGS